MKNHTFWTVVEMPNASKLEVIYYCDDRKLQGEEKERFTQLHIQLHDCICIVKLEKAMAKKTGMLEKIVHNKVINERGHLC
ncbi:MAG: hypothetical protein ABI359_08365 [Ginsengibacter sp.]